MGQGHDLFPPHLVVARLNTLHVDRVNGHPADLELDPRITLTIDVGPDVSPWMVMTKDTYDSELARRARIARREALSMGFWNRVRFLFKPETAHQERGA